MSTGPQERPFTRVGRTARLAVALLLPAATALGQAQEARGPLAACALADPRSDALRGALSAALDRPPSGISLRRLESGPSEALPDRLRHLGATDAFWARTLPGGRLGLRYFRVVPGELFEAELPAPAEDTTASALAEAFWLKLQFLMTSPPGSGRPWPPRPPVPAEPDAALAAHLDVPRVRPWPALPTWTLPNPPTALPGPPPPQGEVEIVIEARPGAETPTMIFSPTAEHGTMATPAEAPPPTPDSPDDDPVRLGLLAAADLPTPWSAGGGLDLLVPVEVAGTSLWARFGVTSLVSHHPWDAETPDGGPLAVWRAQARLGVRLSADALHLWVGGGPFAAHLTRIGSAGDARLLDTWQAGVDAGTLLGWATGPIMPFAGFSFRVSPQSLSATSGGVEHTLAERWQVGIELGVAVSLGR